MFSFDLLLSAVTTGVLLGCFYAAVSIGLSVSFGLLRILSDGTILRSRSDKRLVTS